ncbi:DUF2892 domain-containing protein [Methylocystis sp. B8]|uniref:YgaP family membrane protein n=1 Tax=Methylocystis sp. B8 TaxID=544938 RepID=UPI0010FE9ABA|nr:DUF2892 domain-containing protein [Methylocystis sp. B8]TLG77961.1 DUF2892 domain-containing protein [Methylocystis sp. B8]
MPTTAARVPQNRDEDINRAIRKEAQARLAHFAKHPEKIDDRLDELDREWDIERALEANASSVALVGLTLGLTADRRWLALPVLVSGFLLQHAIQGWCPPLPLLRRLGFRTAEEIGQERNALKALRGDFDKVKKAGNRVHEAARAAGLGCDTHGRTAH